MSETRTIDIKGNTAGMGFRIVHTSVTIPVGEYIKGYRDADKFMKYCRQCKRYNKTWTCPPYDFDTTEYISRYEDAVIIGSKIVFDDATLASCASTDDTKRVSERAMEYAFKTVTAFLRKLEREYPESISFLGTKCLLCGSEPCTRPYGMPCRHPNMVRHSLESVGFDIGKTTQELLGIELKWGKGNKPPEYITLVTALFTNDKRALEVF